MLYPRSGHPGLGTPDLGTPGLDTLGLGAPGLGAPGLGTPGLGTPRSGYPLSWYPQPSWKLGTPRLDAHRLSRPWNQALSSGLSFNPWPYGGLLLFSILVTLSTTLYLERDLAS